MVFACGQHVFESENVSGVRTIVMCGCANSSLARVS